MEKKIKLKDVRYAAPCHYVSSNGGMLSLIDVFDQIYNKEGVLPTIFSFVVATSVILETENDFKDVRIESAIKDPRGGIGCKN